MNARKIKISASVTGLGLNPAKINHMIEISIQSLQHNTTYNTLPFKPLVINKLTNTLPNAQINTKSFEIKNMQLADPEYWQPGNIRRICRHFAPWFG